MDKQNALFREIMLVCAIFILPLAIGMALLNYPDITIIAGIPMWFTLHCSS